MAPETGSKRTSIRVPAGTTIVCPASAAVMETRPSTGVGGGGFDGGAVGGGAVCGACDAEPGPPVGPLCGPLVLGSRLPADVGPQSVLPWVLLAGPQAAGPRAASMASSASNARTRPRRGVVSRSRGGSAPSALPPTTGLRLVVRTLRTGRKRGR